MAIEKKTNALGERQTKMYRFKPYIGNAFEIAGDLIDIDMVNKKRKVL